MECVKPRSLSETALLNTFFEDVPCLQQLAASVSSPPAKPWTKEAAMSTLRARGKHQIKSTLGARGERAGRRFLFCASSVRQEVSFYP